MRIGRGNIRLRIIDRYIGVPAVFAAGMLHRKRSVPSNPASIGLINTAAIGDTILMSAVTADIRGRYPTAKITIFAGPSNYQAARLIEEADRVVHLRVFDPYASLRELRRRPMDILIDFGPWSRLNSLYTIFSGARFTVGFRTARQYRHYGYDLPVEHSSNVHELENHRRLVRAIGIEPSHWPSMQITDRSERVAPTATDGAIVFHMWPGGTGAELKEWPEQRWRAVAETLMKRGYRLVLTGSPGQYSFNEKFISSINSDFRHLISNLAGLNLAETGVILSSAALVISVNTGVMHMAAAANVPLVALHGPTNVTRWGPVSDRAISIESPLKGCGYLNLGFEYPRKKLPSCMEAISTDMVLAASCFALERLGRAVRSSERNNPPYSFRWKVRCTRNGERGRGAASDGRTISANS